MNKKFAYIVSMGKGLESFVYREVDFLIEQGISLTLFTTKFKKNDIYGPKPHWPYHRVTFGYKLIGAAIFALCSLVTRLPLWIQALQKSALIDFVFALYYAPIMRREGITDIHCHFGDHKLFIGFFCSKLLNLPLSVTIHSHELHANPNEEMFKFAIHECDRIFVISELGKGILTDRYSVDPKKITLSHLCVDTDVFSPSENLKVLTVARFEPQKGLKYLLEAARLLEDLPVEFLIVGWGPEPVEQQIKDMGLESRVTIFPKMNQAQLSFLYQSCDIYCLPSVTHKEQGMEGIPVVLMEAMGCGMPVVATDPGAVSEIVEDFLVPAESSSALAEALRNLLLSEELRLEHSKRNRAIVEQKFGLQNVERFSEMLLAD